MKIIENIKRLYTKKYSKTKILLTDSFHLPAANTRAHTRAKIFWAAYIIIPLYCNHGLSVLTKASFYAPSERRETLESLENVSHRV